MSLQYCVTGSETHLHLKTLFASISSFCDMITKIDIYMKLELYYSILRPFHKKEKVQPFFKSATLSEDTKSSKNFASHLSLV